MTAFATAQDLAARLGRTFTPAEAALVNLLLADAADYLRGIIGSKVYPRQQITYTAYPSAGREDLPMSPIVTIDSVTRDDTPIPYTYRPEYIELDSDEPAQVTFTTGYAIPPAELVRFSCVLASQTLFLIEAKLGMTIGGLSSIQIDDFRLAFADAGSQTGMELSERAEARLIKQFGRGNTTIVETR